MRNPCSGCRYFGETFGGCNYLEVTGHSRGCKPGKGCTKYEQNICSNGKNKKSGLHRAKRKRTKISLKEHFNDQMMEMYNAGDNDTVISKKLGISKTTVQNWRSRIGLSPVRRIPIYEKMDKELKALYETHITDQAIADALGISQMTVINWRKKNGLPCLTQRGWYHNLPINEEAEMMELYRRGLTDYEISMMQLKSKDKVRSWRLRRGLPLDGREI